MLRLYRRHRAICPQTSERYRRCACPIYVEGTLAGEEIRKALDLTSWTAAQTLIAKWGEAGEIGGGVVEAPSIADAVAKFIEDARARNVGWETLRKYENLLSRRLLSWCDHHGYTQLKQLTVERMREFRVSWTDGPNYALKNLERLRTFCRFCRDADWIKKNPASCIKAPKVRLKPTLPYTQEEMARIVEACERYPGNHDRLRAFVLVMRFSGLRIGDTIRLEPKMVLDGRIRLYTAKTGQHVDVPVPEFVIEALKRLGNPRWYFWTGHNMRAAVADWSRRLKSLFKLAQVEGGRSHRFRDTAAVSWLVAGLTVEEVAMLLGNSPAVVVKHYSPWVFERQQMLEAKVTASWQTPADGSV